MMKQYKEVCQIGEGTFGCVYKALTPQGKYVAIKKIKFDEDGDEGGMPSTALREISVLKKLGDEPYVVKLLDIQNDVSDKKLALIFQYYDCDLKRYIRDNKDGLAEEEIRRIVKQLLLGIASMHSKKIMHRDLKPQNILLDSGRNVRIADFGLARYVTHLQKTLTREVQTLWYRAPEIMLGMKKYGYAIDIWSIGCIFAELFLRRPLFFGGFYQIQQVFKVFQIMGTPSRAEWPNLELLQNFTPKLPKWNKQPLGAIVNGMSSLGLNLLEKMLCMDPSKRITAAEALSHPYLSGVDA